MELHFVYYCLLEKENQIPVWEQCFGKSELLIEDQKSLQKLMIGYTSHIVSRKLGQKVTIRNFGGPITEIKFQKNYEKVSVKNLFEMILKLDAEKDDEKKLFKTYSSVLARKYLKVDYTREGMFFVIRIKIGGGIFICIYRTDLKEGTITEIKKEKKTVLAHIFENSLPESRDLEKAGMHPALVGGRIRSKDLKIIQRTHAEYIHRFFECMRYGTPSQQATLFSRVLTTSTEEKPISIEDFDKILDAMDRFSSGVQLDDFEEIISDNTSTPIKSLSTDSSKFKNLISKTPTIVPKIIRNEKIRLSTKLGTFSFPMNNTINKNILIGKKGNYLILALKDPDLVMKFGNDFLKLSPLDWGKLKEALEDEE